MKEKLYIQEFICNLVLLNTLSYKISMHNLYTNFVKILDICKLFSKDLVNEQGNIPRPGVVPRFSDLEIVSLSGKISAFTAMQYLNHINNRPIGRVKYALA